MRFLTPTTCCLILLWLAPNAMAQRALLDDSLSPRPFYDLDLVWQPHDVMRSVQALLSDRSDRLPPLTGRVSGVEIILDTRPYVGQVARIYLRLPTAMPGTHSIGNLELSWPNNGLFLAGSVSPGQEALLFEGVIEGPVVAGVLDLRLSIDAGNAPDRFTIEPVYEIEITR